MQPFGRKLLHGAREDELEAARRLYEAPKNVTTKSEPRDVEASGAPTHGRFREHDQG